MTLKVTLSIPPFHLPDKDCRSNSRILVSFRKKLEKVKKFPKDLPTAFMIT